MRLKDLLNGSIITPDSPIPVFVRDASTREGKKGKYMTGAVSDETSSISFKIWNISPAMEEVCVTGSPVLLTAAKVSEWQDSLQLTIDHLQPLTLQEAINYNIVPKAPQPQEKLLAKFSQLIADYVTPQSPGLSELAKLVQKSSIWEKFASMPAARSMHHAYLFGLLEHAVNVAEISIGLSKYSILDINIAAMVFGALFHDIGKTLEYNTNALGMATEFTAAGHQMGHLFMGTSLLRNMTKTLPEGVTVDKKDLDLVSHIILSHHGWLSNGWGSVVNPGCVEAYIVSQADDIEAKINTISGNLINEEVGASIKIPALDFKSFMKF